MRRPAQLLLIVLFLILLAFPVFSEAALDAPVAPPSFLPVFLMPSPSAMPALTPSPSPSPTPLPDTLETMVSVSPDRMVVPVETQVRLTLKSGAANAPVSDVRICRDNGSVICDVGVLSAEGDYSYLFTETITPTDTQLSEGAIVYLLRYTLGKGTKLERAVERALPVTLTQLPAEPSLEFTRALPVTCAKPGEELRIAYRVRNTGNVPLTDLVITDELLGEVGRLERLDPNEKRSFICRYKFKKTAISKPNVRYSHRATREVFEKQLGAAAVYLADERLDIELTSDLSTVSPGGVVTLTYRIANNGTVAYDRLRLSDQTLGIPGRTRHKIRG